MFIAIMIIAGYRGASPMIKSLALASAALAASSSLSAATTEKPVSIVLVHGGFVDGS
jgi:hypothetical protein